MLSTSTPSSEAASPAVLWRKFAAAGIIAGGFCFMALLFSSIFTSARAANRDFIAYWTAGQQLAHHANPYDRKAVVAMERAQGAQDGIVLVMRNPPLAFFLACPLGYIGAKAGLVAWSLLLLGGISLGNWLIWKINGSPDSRLHLFGYLFAPALACQLAGQIGILLLLGVLLFLCLHKSYPYWAGASLLLCALKPHLFLPMFLGLFLISVFQRKWRVLAGFVSAVLAAVLFAFWIDPAGWAQYSQMIRTAGILGERMPALSVVMADMLAPHMPSLRFVPEIFACVWAIWYVAKQRDCWDWNRQGMVLLLVGIACTPYALFTDEAILLPAIFGGLYAVMRAGKSPLLLAILAAAALIEVLAGVKITSLGYLWTVPAWILWYGYASLRTGNIDHPGTR